MAAGRDPGSRKKTVTRRLEKSWRRGRCGHPELSTRVPPSRDKGIKELLREMWVVGMGGVGIGGEFAPEFVGRRGPRLRMG
jgi:hypothetical protein